MNALADLTSLQESVYSHLFDRLAAPELADCVKQWQARRRTRRASQISDIAPVLGCKLMGGEPSKAFPLACYWILITLAHRLLDDALDTTPQTSAKAIVAQNYQAFALQAVASLFLTELANEPYYIDIVKACTNATSLLCSAQSNDVAHRIPSKSYYLQQSLFKTGNVVATALWTGGRLAHQEVDPNHLEALNSFGIATGLMAQIEDDCCDLYEDIEMGHYTLPVICALSVEDETEHLELNNLIIQNKQDVCHSSKLAEKVVEIGGVATARTIAQIYQSRTLESLALLPSNSARELLRLYVEPL